jgi:hypothetical protein
VTHNKESHKVKVLARIYFRIMGLSIGGGRRKIEKHFLFPTQEIGGKTQNGGPQLLVLYWRAGEIHMVKTNGSGWLRWMAERGHPPKSHPKSEIIGCFRTSLS